MYLMLFFHMKLELHARLATYLLSFDTLSQFAPVTSVCSELAEEPKKKDHALLPSLSAFQVAALGHSFPLFAHSFSAKSFACHSYEYPRGWPPPSPPNVQILALPPTPPCCGALQTPRHPTLPVPLRPLESILTKTAPISPLESILTKKQGGGAQRCRFP